ncbi:MAG: DegT/DnrJ/EryC1/StrS family aminotransferase [Bryobacterales bacterium]|nr:DegT/DnrJ/EryC1/StrS family aminotransferase [Bryobacteraceae bacterium]MDW8129680.1 DegT/DnrJ/EryC1/StrS family aminotransferase [Bryobacterales bacterium]
MRVEEGGRTGKTKSPGSPARTEPLPLEFPGAHWLDEEEVQAAARVLRARSPFRYYGPDMQDEVRSFEEEFARFVGARYALAVSSGTGALFTALSALEVGPGQEVIIPAYLWVSIASAVVCHGAIPVLADIDDTFCLDPADVERRITPRTRGIIMAHMSGAPGDVKAIQAIARRHGLFLLEDCAQCVGGSVDGQSVGTFGDVGIFSFQLNKNITAGEGGCLVTSDERLQERAVAWHDLGYCRDRAGRLLLEANGPHLWGRGYRMDELRAAVLRVQLRKLPLVTAAMRASKYRIRQALEALPGVGFRRILDPAGDTGAFLITVYPDAGRARAVQQALRAEGLVARPEGINNIVMADWGLHLYYNNLSLVEHAPLEPSGFPWSAPQNRGLARRYGKGACPRADDLFERSLLLAIPSCLRRKDEDEIIQAFERALARA